MKSRNAFLPFCLLLTSSCYSGESKQLGVPEDFGMAASRVLANHILPAGKTVEKRILVPAGFQRPAAEPNSITTYLRQLPLKPDGSSVLLFDGRKKGNQEAQAAVMDLEIGKRDLQQCADAIMRLRAEYLFQQKKFDQIHFNFTSGDRADYQKFAQGYRAEINGNKVSWQKKAPADNSYKAFRRYLDLVFTYAGTASLEKELQPVKRPDQVEVGDVLIQGGHPGHGVMVVDVAVNQKTGKRIYLLAQSYMPAQDIHILKNPADPKLSPWYSSDITGEIKTPEWSFYPSQLKRFPNW